MKSIDREIIAAFKSVAEDMGFSAEDIWLEIPRNADHGDFSCNIALKAAREQNRNPREIGSELAAAYPIQSEFISKVDVAGPGFINFSIAPAYLQKVLRRIVSSVGEMWDINDGDGERWHFEYVSANPTGPLNVVSARSASVGSTLVNVFKKLGYKTHSEFYVNDTGGQIRRLGASAYAWADVFAGKTQTPRILEGGYHGSYVEGVSREWRKIYPDAYPIADQNEDDYFESVGTIISEIIQESQHKTLEGFGIVFDRWFKESELKLPIDELMGRQNQPTAEEVFRMMAEKNLTYQKDGAVYFKASDFGDSEDRVVKTSADRFTYIVADIAYHLRKHRHYDKAVNLLGPDHHGHILKLKSALKALLGKEPDFFHPIIIQQVNLKRDGKPIKVSKRAGVGITLDDLIEEVGVDASRFFFLMRRTSSPLDFDLELATRHTEDNPVYYVQYAHARIRSILRQPAAREYFSPQDINLGKQPLLSVWKDEYDLSLLVEKEELSLLRIMARFPWTLRTVVRTIDPQPLTTYLIDLAKAFHLFYAHHRVIGDNKDQTIARLILCLGVTSVLKEGLDLIGVSAPERM